MMATGLTKAAIQKLTSDKTTGTLFADGQQPGLYLRVLPSGTKTWMQRERVAGKWHVASLGRADKLDPVQARRKAQATSAKWSDKRATAPSEEMGHTVRKAADDWYTEQIKPKYKRPEQTKAYLDRDLLPLEDKLIAEVSQDDLEKLIGLKRAGSSKGTAATKLYAILRQLFAYALYRKWISTDPTAALKPRFILPKETLRLRKLDDDEIRSAWNIEEPHRGLYRMLLATGQRLSEVLALASTPGNVKDGVWRIDDNKSNRPHSLPITPLMKQIIASGIGSKHRSSAHTLWRARMGGDATQHDIRRTVATRMNELGIRPDVIEHGILNHSRSKTLRDKYQQPNLPPLVLDAFTRWHAELLRIVADQSR